MKLLLVLAIGLGGGYYLGFYDGSQGKPSIVTRVVERVGGNSRGRVTNDIDATMDRLEGAGEPAKKPARTRTP
jgi:hypothetical protein